VRKKRKLNNSIFKTDYQWLIEQCSDKNAYLKYQKPPKVVVEKKR
jgi:hypothetical protein